MRQNHAVFQSWEKTVNAGTAAGTRVHSNLWPFSVINGNQPIEIQSGRQNTLASKRQLMRGDGAFFMGLVIQIDLGIE